jgi:hypothetical protein
MFVDFNILNQLGSPAINSNTFANRPAAGQTGRLFVSTDTFEIYRDNGSTWDLIGGPGSSTITGTGTATQVAYFTSSQAIGSSANLYWDNTNTRLGIGTSTPGVRLDVHGTGNMLHLNSTSATANALMSFQRTGTNVWRLGDQYNGGANFFELHNTALSNNAIEVLAASNEATFLSTKTYSTGNAIGIAVQHNLTIPNGVNVGLAALGGVNSNLNLTLQGSTTVAATGRQGLEGSTSINFTGAGTLTMTQGSTVRAFSALSSVYAFNGSAVGTITHLAGLRICFPNNPGSAVNITNNYALLINDQTTGTGTVTYTNRWGIYQEGASDLNYFAANLLLGSTVNNGYSLQVNGTATITGDLGAGTITPTSKLTIGFGTFTAAASGTTGMFTSATGLEMLSDSYLFETRAGVTLMTLNSAGNLGLAVTPSAWDAGQKVVQVGYGSFYGLSDGGATIISSNAYYNSGWKYSTTNPAAVYQIVGNSHQWLIAPSGTAGNAITFTQAMTLDASGYLGIGVTSPASYYSKNLVVIGESEGGITIASSGLTLQNYLMFARGTSGADRFKGYISYDHASDRLYLASNASINATLTSGGNFLIGTTTDAGYRLGVTGANGDQLYLNNTGQRFTQINFSNNATSKANIWWDNTNNDLVFLASGSGVGDLILNTNGKATFSNSIKTAAPTTGTAAEWKLGSRVAAAVVLDTTQYIEVEVAGTFYKLAIVT